MRDFITNLLKKNLPPNYYYHNPEHTFYVEQAALEIGKNEACTDEELMLLSVAALWHDSGFVNVYKNHEDESCRMVRENLPSFGYSLSQIEIICGMIMATKIPQNPESKLEQILADADLEYLGTESFKIKSKDLFHELQSRNSMLTEEKWDQMQISFLRKHQFFTSYCKEKREPLKQIYLNQLLKATE